MRLLVVEDDPAMAGVLRRGLVEEGFAVDVAADGEDGWWYATEHGYDAILLDAALPGRDGFTLLADLRARAEWTPVLLVTARDGVEDRVHGLDLGADDYVVKPFAFPELLARLRALLRRGRAPRPAELVVGELRLDPARHRAYRAAVPLTLTAKEFAVLEYFMRHPGEVLTRTRLVAHVWDEAAENDSNVVDVYVANLRARIDRPFGSGYLQTVRGVGYRLTDGGAGADAPSA
jgi:two-component system OmpR family response regulator